jgi:hypothetical protein
MHKRRREEVLGEGRCGRVGRCGRNKRNREYRLTTDMRTTKGQAAFGHNVQWIITYSFMFKKLVLGTVGRFVSMRVERTYSII